MGEFTGTHRHRVTLSDNTDYFYFSVKNFLINILIRRVKYTISELSYDNHQSVMLNPILYEGKNRTTCLAKSQEGKGELKQKKNPDITSEIWTFYCEQFRQYQYCMQFSRQYLQLPVNLGKLLFLDWND